MFLCVGTFLFNCCSNKCLNQLMLSALDRLVITNYKCLQSWTLCGCIHTRSTSLKKQLHNRPLDRLLCVLCLHKECSKKSKQLTTISLKVHGGINSSFLHFLTDDVAYTYFYLSMQKNVFPRWKYTG